MAPAAASEERTLESLEAERARLAQDRERTQKRLEELERTARSQAMEAQNIVEMAVRDLNLSQEKSVKALEARLDELKNSDSTRAKAIEGVRAEVQGVKALAEQVEAGVQKVEKAQSEDPCAERLEDVAHRTEQLEAQVGRMPGETGQAGGAEELSRLGQEVESLKSTVQKLEEESSRQDGVIKEQADELLRLGSAKVDVELYQKDGEERATRLTDLAEALEACRAESAAQQQELRGRDDPTERIGDLEKACQDLKAKIQEVSEELETGMQRAADNMDKVKTSTGAEISKNAKRSEELGKEQERISGSLQSSLGTLQATKAELESSNKEVLEKASATQKSFEQLEKRTEATFLQLNDRLEEMGRVERARLASIEKEAVDGVARARSECRAETERLRVDYEKDSSRLELDLGDLHAKYDVSKQELNFFQTRLAEQRDWAEEQIAELRTAAKAAQVDTRETTTVTTKMLHALRDDAVGFREKMAGYISTLQRSADSQGDAISTLETQRSRIRKELDGLFTDHQAYVEDMDSWANDVRLKVERLFRALEPSRVEWHIARAERKARELRRPLGLKSQGFSLKGLRQVAIEFYPEGHHTSPEGLAAVRVFMPQDAHVRYQIWIGRTSEGVREHSPGDSCSIDLLVESWKEKIVGDGSISIVLEVLRDFRDQDQSLARDIRIEST
jgi:chromosome segregation ATPase